MKKIWLAGALLLCAALPLTGCGQKQSVTITVRNLTGSSIASLELAQMSDTSNHRNWMEDNWLDDGAEQKLKRILKKLRAALQN